MEPVPAPTGVQISEKSQLVQAHGLVAGAGPLPGSFSEVEHHGIGGPVEFILQLGRTRGHGPSLPVLQFDVLEQKTVDIEFFVCELRVARGDESIVSHYYLLSPARNGPASP